MQTECRQQSKTKRPKFIRKVTCQVCGDIANDHTHYGGVACYSCKAFFRRKVLCHKQMQCTKSGQCEINKANRKGCKLCRLQKCFEIGMKAEWVMTEEDKHEQEETARIKREQRSNSDVNGVLTTYQKRMRKRRQGFQASGSDHSEDSSIMTNDQGIIYLNEDDLLANLVHPEQSLIIEPADPSLNYLSSPGLNQEEQYFIDNLVTTKYNAAKNTPIPKGLQEKIIERFRSAISMNEDLLDESIEFIKQRLKTFANEIEIFKTFPLDFQYKLISRNLTMMFLVQSLKMFKPSNGTDKSTTPASSKNTITISLFLKSPWAADVSLEQKFQQLHHQLSELYLDEQTSILLSLLSLFESTTLNELEHLEKLQDTQQFIHQLMRRYLQTSIGDYNAAREMMNTFMKSVQNLREMADILDFQRLRFI